MKTLLKIDEATEVEYLYDSNPEKFLLIKVGANDGWMCDNLYDFVMENDPRSIMIEPIPCYFSALKENFKSLKNIKYEMIAIDNQDGQREMTYIHDKKFQSGEVTFRLESTPHLIKEHWARGLGSFYKDKNNLGCPELAQHAEKITVKTKTIESILNKYNVDSNTNLVLATDCEGHDYEILKNFNFNKIKPKIYISEIFGETRYPPSHPRYNPEDSTGGLYAVEEYEDAIRIFQQNGYIAYASSKVSDLIAILK
tara:strand:+ start:268 stop:1029 length:762 start_codon:yes stop_codon:yes gene_type:complete